MTAARRVSLGAEAALAFGAGAASFALVALALAVSDHVVFAAILGALCALAVVAMARRWGIGYAVPAAMAGLLAFDWFEFPPTHAHEFPDTANLLDLLVYLAVAVLVGGLAASSGRRAAASEVARGALAEEQAALRRVATLVARQSPPEHVFAAVGEEVGRLLRVEDALMCRYEDDGTATVVASVGEAEAVFGTHLTVEGDNVLARVRRTGLPARIERGVRSSVGTPIVIEGRLWGVIIVGTRRALPPGTEARVGEFTELVATAISNIEARSELAASRARIVEATDEERRRVVRDLHDGAQQRLVHTVITLKLARRALERGDDRAPALVTEALDHAGHATTELRELAHGILPTVLTRGGLRAGVDALASRMPVPVDIAISVDRLPAPIEATAYFLVAEALTNVAKHAHARHAAVTARVEGGTLRVDVRDDGVGGARPDGSGLVGLADRVAVLDGRVRIESPAAGGTVVAATIPIS